MKQDILLLNADNSILSTVDLIRAVGLHINKKINIIDFYEDSKILHPKLPIKKPKTICLKKYIYIPYRHVKLTRKNVFKRDKYICQYCGVKLNNKSATIDHIVPKSHHQYPGHTWKNIVTCCRKCNNRKDNKSLKEVNMKLLNKPFEPKIEHVNYLI